MTQVKDPCTGNKIVTIWNPKVQIRPYTSMDGVVDLKDHIANQRIPVFYKTVPTLDFKRDREGWSKLLRLIESKEQQQSFWEFIERLQKVRIAFNRLLL